MWQALGRNWGMGGLREPGLFHLLLSIIEFVKPSTITRKIQNEEEQW